MIYLGSEANFRVSSFTYQKSLDRNSKNSVDDFGPGYSSLSYIKTLPVDVLKIDRSFIQDVPGDADGESIVRVIIALAREMNIELFAEGIENPQQIEFLINEGCYKAQGFFLVKPQSAAQISLLDLPIARLRCEELAEDSRADCLKRSLSIDLLYSI